tara:strand:+ start:1569 stop:1931 length:363 start_codon:yes stop_codon:yes gene_type:complete
MYLKQITPAQEREAARAVLVLRVAEAVNHLAATMQSVNKSFYSVDSEQLVEDLNEDLESSLELFAANLALGTVVNSHLDMLDLPKYAKRAPLEISDSTITISKKGFVYTEPIVEDEEVEG